MICFWVRSGLFAVCSVICILGAVFIAVVPGNAFICLWGSEGVVATEMAGDIGLVNGGVVVLSGVVVINEPLAPWIPVVELDVGTAC